MKVTFGIDLSAFTSTMDQAKAVVSSKKSDDLGALVKKALSVGEIAKNGTIPLFF